MAAPSKPPTTARAKGKVSKNDAMPVSVVQDAAAGVGSGTPYDTTGSQVNPVIGTGKGGWSATPGTNRPVPTVEQIPDPLNTPGAKPDLTILGASGTSFFGGLIQNDEYNPELQWRDWVLKVEQMLRSDAQVEALFRLTVNTLLAAKWSVEPGSEDAADVEIASFVESALFHDVMYETAAGVTLKQSWSQILRHVLLMLPFGFSPLEICWRTEDDGEGGYWVKFAKFQPLLPRTVYRWWVGEDNELEAIQTWSWKNYAYRFTNIPVSKLLLFTHNQQGQNFEGLSILRPVFPYWWYKQNFLKINAIAIERNGVEIPVIHLGTNATAADAQAALQQGQNARVNAAPAIVQPHDWTFEYPRMSQNHAEAILPSIQYCDVMMARAWFEQFINLGSTEVGAYNLDVSQTRTWLTGLQAEATDICDTFQPVIEQLVRWNYGEQAVYPKLVCAKLIAQNVSALSDAITAFQAYLPPSTEMNDFIADLVGVPKPPANQVEATNPSGPDGGADGGVENEDSGDEGAQDSGDSGDGGDAAMSEGMAETAALLSEALAALYAHDAVEKGATLLYSPDQPRIKGKFTYGGRGRQESGGGRGHAKGEKSSMTGEPHARGGGGGGGSGSGGEGKAKGTPAKAEKATARAKAAGHAKAEGEHRGVNEARGKGGKGGAKADEEKVAAAKKAILESKGPARHTTLGKIDPYEIHGDIGAEHTRTILEHATAKRLGTAVKAVQDRNPGTKPIGATNAAKVDYIMHHVAGEHNAYSESLMKSAAAKAPTEGAASGKSATETTRDAKGKTEEVKPREQAARSKNALPLLDLEAHGHVPEDLLNPYAPINPHALRQLYGDEQLRPAINRYSMTKLREATALMQRQFPGTGPEHVSRDSMVDYLARHASNDERTAREFFKPNTPVEHDARGVAKVSPVRAAKEADPVAKARAAEVRAQAARDKVSAEHDAAFKAWARALDAHGGDYSHPDAKAAQAAWEAVGRRVGKADMALERARRATDEAQHPSLPKPSTPKEGRVERAARAATPLGRAAEADRVQGTKAPAEPKATEAATRGGKASKGYEAWKAGFESAIAKMDSGKATWQEREQFFNRLGAHRNYMARYRKEKGPDAFNVRVTSDGSQ